VAQPKLLDPRTDLYSLGAIWFELLVGRAPAGSRLEQQLKAAPSVPTADIHLILDLLAPLESRIPSCSAFLEQVS
jgi:serine/threonine-protein kinase